jgi:hypothetical protein
LENTYPGLVKEDVLFTRKGSSAVIFPALNPYLEDRWFVVLQDGLCMYSTYTTGFGTEPQKESQILNKMTAEYMQMRAKRDGTTLHFSSNVDGVKKHIKITPTWYAETGGVKYKLWSWKERQKVLVRSDGAFVGAVTVGTGVLFKLAGARTKPAIAMAASTGLGAAMANFMNHRGRTNALREFDNAPGRRRE